MIMRCGIPDSKYGTIHSWLRKTYGSANKCESAECTGIGTRFHYALKPGMEYEKKRENFEMLCISCHFKQDFKDKNRKRIKPFTPQNIENYRNAQLGKKHPEYTERFSGENSPWWGRHHTEEVKHKLLSYRAKATKEQIIEIRQKHKDGTKQNVLAKEYGLSCASVCRIIKNKRYRLW